MQWQFLQRSFFVMVLCGILFTTCECSILRAQPSGNALSNASGNEEHKIRAVIEQLFASMLSGDTAAIRALLAPDVRLATTGKRDGVEFYRVESVEAWLGGVARAPKGTLDERLTSLEIRVDNELAMAWAPYEFYVAEKFSHCGTNAFHLTKTSSGWKILFITDTRRREPCRK